MSENAPDHDLAEMKERGPRLAQPVRITEQAWPEGTKPVVSICTTAYNNQDFIGECLDGFLMQETTFPVEILIHDDASTDSTASIIREREARYPHIIRPIYQTENQFSKGRQIDITFNFPRARGRYIALCQGDDYWTSPGKLQTQVDFMESHPGYSGCFHNVMVVYEDKSKSRHPRFAEPLKDTFTVGDLAASNVISTPSILFRARLFPEFPAWYSRMPIGDWPLHVLNAEHGDIGYIDQLLAVYRVHGGGVWSSLRAAETYKINIQVAEVIDAYLGFRYTRAIRKNIAYWHYRAAVNMSGDGADKDITSHLRASMRNCLYHERISKKAFLALYIKHSCPALYAGLKRVQKVLGGNRG